MAHTVWPVVAELRDGIRILRLHGHLDYDYGATRYPEPESFVRAALEERRYPIVLDLSHVWSMHPLALVTLARLSAQSLQAGLPVRWAGLRRRLTDVLCKARLNGIVTVFATEAEAIDSLRQP
jgi:anti-anti-sigma regulatory factor